MSQSYKGLTKTTSAFPLVILALCEIKNNIFYLFYQFRGKGVKYPCEFNPKKSSTATVEVDTQEMWERLDKVDPAWLVDANSGWRKPEDNDMRYFFNFAIVYITTKIKFLYRIP